MSGFRHNGLPPGFTLMELMVVILIISIMSAVIVAEMHGTLQDAVLRATGQELATAFTAASSRSVAINRPLRIQLDVVNHRYFTERSARGGSEFFPVHDVPGGEGKIDSRITANVLPPGMGFPDQAAEDSPDDVVSQENEILPPERISSVTFYPDGTAENRAVELTDRDGYRMGLRINPITAQVKILAMGHK